MCRNFVIRYIISGNMTDKSYRPINEVLDQLENSLQGESIAVKEVIETLGPQSFASLMLGFSLISTSPASAIPGITTLVAAIVFILLAQMAMGRKSVWLPRFITRRHMSSSKLRRGIHWLRKPVRFVEPFLKERLSFLFNPPWFWLPLISILALTLFMPFMEVIPTSGSIASAIIALFAAGLLIRDGVLVFASLIFLLSMPIAVWQFGFAS